MKISAFVLLLTYSSATWAAACATNPGADGTCGPATSYKITLVEAALCQDANCTSNYVVGSGTTTFDIASVTVGASIGSYANFDSVPPGTYTHMRAIISRTITMTAAAVVATNGTCPAQNAAPLSVYNGSEGYGDAITVAAIPGVTWNDPAKTQIKAITTLTTPLVIPQAGRRPSISIAFGTTSALLCANIGGPAVLLVPQPPEIAVSVVP